MNLFKAQQSTVKEEERSSNKLPGEGLQQHKLPLLLTKLLKDLVRADNDLLRRGRRHAALSNFKPVKPHAAVVGLLPAPTRLKKRNDGPIKETPLKTPRQVRRRRLLCTAVYCRGGGGGEVWVWVGGWEGRGG